MDMPHAEQSNVNRLITSAQKLYIWVKTYLLNTLTLSVIYGYTHPHVFCEGYGFMRYLFTAFHVEEKVNIVIIVKVVENWRQLDRLSAIKIFTQEH